MPTDHVCDTCGQPCQGGCRDYTGATGEQRHGCDDEHACMAAYAARRTPSATKKGGKL
jgi:hypothetical protein